MELLVDYSPELSQKDYKKRPDSPTPHRLSATLLALPLALLPWQATRLVGMFVSWLAIARSDAQEHSKAALS